MSKIKTAVVLEGGGMRGAYTAGCLSWLLDEGIEFDSAYGISTGAVHLCNFLMKDKENLYKFSTEYIADKNAIGFKALLKCGKIVDYEWLFETFLDQQLHYSIDSLKNYDKEAYIGLYDLAEGKTVYYRVQDMDIHMLKAACSLPVLGRVIEYKGHKYLDGGITDMIPIEQAVKDGCNRIIIITTKPIDYVRKEAPFIVNAAMSLEFGKKCPSVPRDYKIRHINYYKQIDLINNLVKEKKAIYRYPTVAVEVSRLGGNQEDLVKLYNNGREDMEKQRQEIYTLLNKNENK